jgi:hypothetical protein
MIRKGQAITLGPSTASAGDLLRTLLSIDELLVGSIGHEDSLFLLGKAELPFPAFPDKEGASPMEVLSLKVLYNVTLTTR